MLPEPGILGNPYGNWIHAIGSRPDRPFRFAVPLKTNAFGDVFNPISCAARIATHFEHALCTIFCTRDRPYTRDIINMYPFEKNVCEMKVGWDQVPFQIMNGVLIDYDTSHELYQDLVLSSLMLSNANFPSLPRGRSGLTTALQRLMPAISERTASTQRDGSARCTGANRHTNTRRLRTFVTWIPRLITR
jgi:hypothetical protein